MKPTATIRAFPSDFVVEEIPAYAPTGAGGHLFLWVRKTGLTTIQCGQLLARSFGVDPRDVGYAGMKDRHAVTTQMFSVPFSEAREVSQAVDGCCLQGVEILDAKRHPHKLRTGHLVGNRFRILLRNLDSPSAASAVAEVLLKAQAEGIPNAFGPQRFGRDGSNPLRAMCWLRGETRGPSNPRHRRLLFSSVQSMLFDHVLQRRLADGTWNTVLMGDLAKRHDTGGLFICSEEAEDARRALLGEVSATGPIFGSRMRWPTGKAEQIENEVLREHLGDQSLLDRFSKLGEGTRRPLRFMPSSVQVCSSTDEPGVLVADFVLPKGAYATTFLAAACEWIDANRQPSEEAGETFPSDELLQHTPADRE